MRGNAAVAQIVLVRDQQGARFAKCPRDMGLRRRLCVAYGEVEPLLHEVHEPIVEIELDTDLGIAMQEGNEHRRESLPAQRHGCSTAEGGL